MALEQHNTTFEFETMLRSHLSAGARGGSMVEACYGFDADTASAYLEDALGQAPRSRYDAHLAGCPPCRRSVIDLSRLIQSSPSIGQTVNPQTLPVVIPSRDGEGWKSVVAGWLGLSEWNLATRNWGLATAGMAGAVLLAILATQLWRQPGQSQQIAGITPASTIDGIQSPDNLPTPSETTAADGGGIAPMESQTSVRSNVPFPALAGTVNQPSSLSGKTDSANGINAESVTGLASLGNTTEAFLPNLPAPSPNVTPMLGNGFASSLAPNFTPLVESKQPVAVPEPPPEGANARILTPLNPSPSDNPMGRGQKAPPTPNVFNRAFAFVPTRKDAAERKLEVKEIEEGAPKVLAVRVRDKVFNFRSGMWIDQAYKPDMAWRITKLTQDSDEYKKVLADEPQLKDFFDRGAVIVIWKDKIYKVVAK